MEERESERGLSRRRPRRTPLWMILPIVGALLAALFLFPLGLLRPPQPRWHVQRLIAPPSDEFDQARLYEETEVARVSFGTPGDAEAWRSGDGNAVVGVPGGGIRLTGDEATRRLVGPLGQEAEAVDVIEIDLTQDAPSAVALFWPRADGRLDAHHAQARLPDPEGTVRFVVASHPRWRGRIERIAVQPSFTAQRVLLRAIRFLAFGLSAGRAADAPTSVHTVELDGDSRPALPVLMGRPASLSVEVPPRARLRFALGLPEHVTTSASFVLSLSGSDGEEEPILQRRVRRGHQDAGWSEQEVDLGAWAGRKVTLSLVIGADGRESAPIGFWGNPLLRWPERGPPRPNVLLISADTLRADHLSLYGYRRATSPHLESWARRRGVVFRNAVAPSPWTLPSHVSLFTGLDAHRHGVSRQGPIPGELPVLAELFRDAGYLTLGSTGGGLVDARFGLGRGFDVYRSREAAVPGDPRSELERGVEDVLDWITRHSREPFFLFFHTYETHTPLEAKEPYFTRLRGHAGPLPDRPLNAEPVTPEPSDGFRRRYRLVWTHPLPEVEARASAGPEAEPASPRPDLDDPQLALDLYDSAIASLDSALGRLLDRLEELGLAETTIVVFTSDHGESFGENGLWAHTHLQDTNLMIPLVVAPRPPAGPRSVERQVRLIDIAPTVLEMAGLARPPAIGGRSLLPLASGGTDTHPEEAWAYSSRTNWGLGLRVANRWKLIVPNTIWPALRGRDQLHDLSADPAETANVAAERPSHAALRALATRELLSIRNGVLITARCDRVPCFEGVVRGLGRERDTVSSPDLACACVEPVPGGTRLTLRPGDGFTIVYEDVVDGELDLELESTADPSQRRRLSRRVGPGQAPFALHLDGSGWRLDETLAAPPATGLHVSYQGSVSEPRPEVAQEMEERLRALGYIQ